MGTTGRNRRIAKFALLAIVVLGVVCWRFPLFRVVPLEQVRANAKAGTFDAAQTALDFWSAKLLPAAEETVELNHLLAVFEKEAADARSRYGQTLGIGGATMFLTRGSGEIVAVEKNAVTVALDGAGTRVRLVTGLLFGNTVRDASGLLDVSAYSDSQAFNAISAELNRIVETSVMPTLKEGAAVGKTVRFAGCFELEDDATPDTLTVIPLKIEWP